MNFSPGSIFFGGATFFNPSAPTGADNGTSMNGTLVELGQAVGALGDPGKLLNDREIPLNGHSVIMRDVAANAALKFKQAVLNTNVPDILFLSPAGVELARIAAPNASQILIGFNSGAALAGTAFNIGLGNNVFGASAGSNNSIMIGSGAGQGGNDFDHCIGIGNDVFDRNGAAIGPVNIALGHNQVAGGAGLTVGLRNIFIGTNNCNGAGADLIGDFNTILGGLNSIGGGLSNTILIASLQNNGINHYTLSNTVVIGDVSQNTLFGVPKLGPWTDNGNRVQVYSGNIWMQGGIAPAIRASVGLAENFGATDYTILADATAGNYVLTINPATTSQRMGNLKKIDATVNTVTLTASSGNVFGMGAPAPSISIGVQGQSLSFQSDGTNIYIL